MSRGSRSQLCKRPLAVVGACTTPRDPLPFLYPRWLHTQGREVLADASTSAVPIRFHLTAMTKGGGEKFKRVKGPRNARSSRPKLSKSEALQAPDKPKDSFQKSFAKREDLKPAFRRIEELPASDHSLDSVTDSFGYPRSSTAKIHGDQTLSLLERMMQSMEVDETPADNLEAFERASVNVKRHDLEALDSESFGLNAAQLERLRGSTRISKYWKDRSMAAKSQHKLKGDWSYDWRIALQDLQQHTPLDSEGRFGDSQQPAKTKVSSEGHDNTSVFASFEGGDQDDWTKAKFLKIVSVLTGPESRIRKLLWRLLQDRGENTQVSQSEWVFRVRNALMQLFDDRTTRMSLSVEAFHLALHFFSTNYMLNYARRLINLMDEVNILPTTKTFNMLLWASAQEKDLHNYTSLLKSMIVRDLKPNASTWVSLVVAVESNVVKYNIAEVMKDMGLLEDDRVLRRLVAQLLDTELWYHTEQNHSFPVLIERLDLEYGPRWLSKYAAHKICKRLCDAGSVPQVVQLLKLMNHRGCHPDVAFLGATLKLCVKVQDPALALRFLELFQGVYDIRPLHDELTALFMLGFSTHSYNICKLVWSVACVDEMVAYPVRRFVSVTLQRNTPQVIKSEEDRWLKHAGKVIMGPGYQVEGELGIDSPGRLDTLTTLSEWTPAGDQRKRCQILADKILTEDISAANQYAYNFRRDFLSDFRSAIEKDKTWNSVQWKDKYQDDLLWKIQSSIKINMQRKAQPDGTVSDPIIDATEELSLPPIRRVRSRILHSTN